MLPKLDGFEVCRRIREFSLVPVVMLTARGEPVDKLRGFEMGADDYLGKPFVPAELWPGYAPSCAAASKARQPPPRPWSAAARLPSICCGGG